LSDRLRQFVRARVASAADVDDILQSVFLRIHQNSQSLRQVDRLESWVFQIARNAVADFFRQRPALSATEAALVAEAAPENEENANREVAGCIAALIDCLPDDQRRAVSLYELQGVSQADIAHRESISLSAAKSRVQRGRRNLEAILLECCRFQLDTHGNVLEYDAANPDCGSGCCCKDGCS
jgi:RNA polymerase sigma-70 factor (ECF subfamily)